MIALGAIGVTLTYGLLRFANFAHGEFATWGAYAALVDCRVRFGTSGETIGELTFGWHLVVALVGAMVFTALLAAALDSRPVPQPATAWQRHRAGDREFRRIARAAQRARIRVRAAALTTTPAKSRSTVPLGAGMRATWDQLSVLCLRAGADGRDASDAGVARRWVGRCGQRAKPDLARLAGIDVPGSCGSRGCSAAAWRRRRGCFSASPCSFGRPWGSSCCCRCSRRRYLGGIGSVPGAMVGGMVIGIAEAAAVPIAGAQYRAASRVPGAAGDAAAAPAPALFGRARPDGHRQATCCSS